MQEFSSTVLHMPSPYYCFISVSYGNVSKQILVLPMKNHLISSR